MTEQISKAAAERLKAEFYKHRERLRMKPTDRVLIRTARHERIRNWLWIAGCIIAFAAGIVLMQIIQYWQLLHRVGWRAE